MREMTRVLRIHLGESRLHYRHAPQAQSPGTSLTFSGGGDGLRQLQLGASIPMLAFAEIPASPAAPQGRPGNSPRTQTWMLGIGAESENDAIGGYSAFDTDTQGFMLGGDRRVGEQWILGLSAGNSRTDVVTSELATGKLETWQGSLYATWFDERYHFEAGVAYGEQAFDNQRVLQVGSASRTATSSHDGDAWNLFAGGGVSFGTERWTVQPYLSLNYIAASEEAYEESGAGSMNLLVPAQDAQALFGEAGAAFSVRHSLRSALIDWHAMLAMGYDFGIDDGGFHYSYTGSPLDVFSIGGRPASDTSTLYGVGVSLIGDRSVLSLDYQGASSSDRAEDYLSARVVLRF
jgi:outer membrane autotransporter protein